ncbi:MAG: hypothetical protein NC344_10435 [Bacteroidales bacterium]|nr:hypothetical protein [Bacteroidales bacterium]MCM1148221.1 hypothetical protein [Bacteroidales bacterium]MCM1206948.1 hypothetical protein [Bacillota bacterium]MCM1511202.1 hypothetical protein [Clostridium sp.]
MTHHGIHTGIRHMLLTAFLSLSALNAVAQETSWKDGGMLFTMGAGYEHMPDAYSPQGIALDVSARFYTSERLFWEINGHWGTHSGNKDVMQKGHPFSIHDERNCLLAATGPGYEVMQTGNRLFDVYVKALIGYGVRKADYDDYQPCTPDGSDGSTSNDGKVTLGCSDSHKGIAAVLGIGADLRFKRWTLTPSVNAVYVGKKWNIATMLSVGYFY